jgi:hypothetical protein
LLLLLGISGSLLRCFRLGKASLSFCPKVAGGLTKQSISVTFLESKGGS